MENNGGNAGAGARPRRGSAQIYEDVREDILWLRMKPGTALDEVALAKRFNVSRTPVREALLLLAGEDLVTLLPNRTSIVAHHSLDNMGEYLDTQYILSRAVARAAAMSRTEDDLDQLRGAADEYVRIAAEGAPEQILRAELDLRGGISRSAHNQFLDKFYRLILDYGMRAKVMHFYATARREEISAAAENSSCLVDAIQARDPERSDEIMSRLLSAELEVFCRRIEPKFGSHFQLSQAMPS